MTETLHTGDNLEYMQTLPSESIDLIYSDILYGTGRNFIDYKDIKADRKTVEAFYIPRITEMHRLLKQTGSIYLQMDYKISHWIRCILDDIFGIERIINEIIWCYTNVASKSKKFQCKHDNILFYSKSENYIFNEQRISLSRMPSEKGRFGQITKEEQFEMFAKGKRLEDWWLIGAIHIFNTEIVGYATQKPLELMNRIILASSNEGDVCADFFAGSGSFGEAAKKLNRNVILNDINPNAIKLCKQRLNEANDLFNSCA